MKKALPIIIVLVVLIGGYFMLSMNYNNSALVHKQATDKSWADVQGAYQRRNDLIGNLVNTVKGAADFEKSTLEAVVNARAKATSVNIDPSNMTPEKFQEFQQAQSGVSSALGRLLVTVEKYPDLKTNQNFLKLQDELASTENQILTQRTRFNDAVAVYNSYVLKMPNKFFLSDYKERPYFQAEAGAEKAPEVKF
ncbi:LemA family protein [Myroides odoratimimus]|uniref:LemA family protein n=1 Tax=Myroides odoratimimus TaxID=76832 RepID=UPI00103F78DA|nr:LemA family protein [Myroides odoratimimus]MCA4791737.1 LemA family protein [Myroides odoratimimus]MCA4805718.1 LemA family protein [Myroides odoratimimus]MCA4818998.1 LemA family protein [Myroides odoratimimus]MDM1059105.1 LemA family protein [Myroides odoratimimus]MDM1091807.1 LemA family protein [Myroides odoratimimus]